METNTTTQQSAQSALARVQQKLRARKDKQNAFGGYTYRNKEGILEAVKPHLAETGATLTIQEELLNLGNRYYIKATAAFTAPNGERITSTAYAREAETKKGMDEAQITGAASSYAGKYALCNLLAIDDSSVDPDTNNDHGKRLPTLAEIAEIAACNTVADLNTYYRILSKRGVALGYVADLCKERKAQITATDENTNTTPTHA